MGLLTNEMPRVWRLRKYLCETKCYEEFEDLSETNIPLPRKEWNMHIFSETGQKVGELLCFFKLLFQYCIPAG
jgi:hypothetical protein